MLGLVRILALILICSAAHAQVPMTGAGLSKPPVAGGPYVGAGDVVSGAVMAFSTRGYSAAYSTGSNPGVRVCDTVGGTICQDINILATGKLDIASLQTFATSNCGGSSGSCKVATAYDQSGHNGCGGSPCNATQATQANRPVLNQSCFGGSPCIQFAGGVSEQLATATPTASTAQPFTQSCVGERTSTLAFNTCIGDGAAGVNQIGFGDIANKAFLYSGTAVQQATQTDGSPHAMQGVFNDGIATLFYIDGTQTALANIGGTAFGLNTVILGNGNNSMNGYIAEAITWAGTFSSGVSCASQAACLAALNTNQHSNTNGFNF